MKLTQRHVDVINVMYERNTTLAHGSEEDRRVLTRMIAEQLAFENGPSWGTKAQGATHPQSKDAIAFQTSTSKKDFEIWDWQNGTTRAPQVHVGQAGVPVTGQWFISVSPVNHLASTGPEPPEPPEPGGVTNEEILKEIQDNQSVLMSEHNTIISRLQNLELIAADIQKTVNQIYAVVGSSGTVKFPPYSGRVSLLGTTTLNPVTETQKPV
jgi:hypothetical protein